MHSLNVFIFYATCLLYKIHAQCPWSYGEWNEQSICYGVPDLLTNNNGAPVDTMVSSLSAGCRGPLVLEDFCLFDKLFHVTKEKIPARVGHARGTGAYGYLVITDESFSHYCRASLFQHLGQETPLFVRFSTAVQEIGTCDTLRSLRGTAIKFYTFDGNWDLVGNNFPIFAIKHPQLLPSLFHCQKPDPTSYLQNYTNFWDFMTQRPETCYQLMLTFSGYGIPDGYRHLNMHGSHTFKVVNATGHPFYCKFHFRTDQGIKNLNSSYAASLCGTDPDYSRRDLYESIAAGQCPSWTMCYQIMTFEEAEKCSFNPFDLTKVWPQGDYPYHEIGKLVLNKNPENFYAEVEQSAFSPAHLVPGVEPSPDPMYSARMFSYSDAQHYRLGTNHQQLPINRPIVPVNNVNRDGSMCIDNQAGRPNYYPNSYSGNICPEAEQSKWFVTGDVERHFDDLDNFSQPGTFYRCVLNETQKTEFITNLGTNLKNVHYDLQMKAVDMFSKVDSELGDRLYCYLNEAQ